MESVCWVCSPERDGSHPAVHLLALKTKAPEVLKTPGASFLGSGGGIREQPSAAKARFDSGNRRQLPVSLHLPHRLELGGHVGSPLFQHGLELGLAGIPCPEGSVCVDDPRDECDRQAGGADCDGLCAPGRERMPLGWEP